MSQTHLVACPSCFRHVRARERSCPFCQSTLSEAVRESPEPQGPAVRLSRAALYAFGVGSLTVATMCGSTTVSASVPYGPDVFGGDVVGGDCTGNVYVTGSTGYLVCDDGKWTYSDSTLGYTPETLADGGVDAGADVGVSVDANADVATSADASVDADAGADVGGVGDSGSDSGR